jgi:hypothetical protein
MVNGLELPARFVGEAMEKVFGYMPACEEPPLGVKSGNNLRIAFFQMQYAHGCLLNECKRPPGDFGIASKPIPIKNIFESITITVHD